MTEMEKTHSSVLDFQIEDIHETKKVSKTRKHRDRVCLMPTEVTQLCPQHESLQNCKVYPYSRKRWHILTHVHFAITVSGIQQPRYSFQ